MIWPFNRKTKPAAPAAPVTCSQAGKMGAAALKAQGREVIRAQTRQMYRNAGLPVPDVLAEGVRP